MAILASFSSTDCELSLTEISRRTRLSASTAHRLIAELASSGFLERSADLRYHVGPWLRELAELSPHRAGLLASAVPVLDDLFEVTGQTVSLAVAEGAEVVSVARVSAGGAGSCAVGVSQRAPLAGTASGLVLVAYGAPQLRDAVLSSPRTHRGNLQASLVHRLDRAIAEVRATGMAISDGTAEQRGASVAAPVFDASDFAVAALSLAVPFQMARSSVSYIPTVRLAARGLSRTFRGGLPPAAERTANGPTGSANADRPKLPGQMWRGRRSTPRPGQQRGRWHLEYADNATCGGRGFPAG
jgi:DNA-binding IclR family transcriptional regulator